MLSSLFWPFQSLFFLCRREIQNSETGHCSNEDARACMELVKLKLENGWQIMIPSPCESYEPCLLYIAYIPNLKSANFILMADLSKHT